jgi:hypothetical protein
MKPEIHPDIRAFWEKDGYKVKPRMPSEYHTSMLWDLVKDKVIGQTIAISFKESSHSEFGDWENDHTEYLIDGHTFNEADMLKVIKLKAFI